MIIITNSRADVGHAANIPSPQEHVKRFFSNKCILLIYVDGLARLLYILGLTQLGERLLLGWDADLNPKFGEIYSLVISTTN